MRNLLLLLALANILYYMWGRFVDNPDETGVVVVSESELGPPLDVSSMVVAEAATSVGAVLGFRQAVRSGCPCGPFLRDHWPVQG